MKSQRIDSSSFADNLQNQPADARDVEAVSKLKRSKKATTDEEWIKPIKKAQPVEISVEKQENEIDLIREANAKTRREFFKRIHGHEADRKCSGEAYDTCKYMDDGVPINSWNEHEQDLLDPVEHPNYPEQKEQLDRRIKEFNSK